MTLSPEDLAKALDSEGSTSSRTNKIDNFLKSIKGTKLYEAVLRALTDRIDDDYRVSAPRLAALLEQAGQQISKTTIKEWRYKHGRSRSST